MFNGAAIKDFSAIILFWIMFAIRIAIKQVAITAVM